jgi:hypothetical protein
VLSLERNPSNSLIFFAEAVIFTTCVRMNPANIENIRRRIQIACQRAGRSPEEVTLVAVSKTFPAGSIREVVECGVPDVGENYVQELVRKQEMLANPSIRWHFIGHLQTNKVKFIGSFIHLIHAVDNTRVAAEINRRASAVGRTIDILVEVNTTGEQSKYGVQPDDAGRLMNDFSDLQNIRVTGLMTMGLFGPDPEASRPAFRRLRLAKDRLSDMKQRNVDLKHLSMGMTGDFEVAIEEGATIIRIGTGIFGQRKRSSQPDNPQ